MAQEVIKMLCTVEGSNEELDTYWHAILDYDCARTVCGHAADPCSEFEWKSKMVKRGGITCQDCLKVIYAIKDIKL